MELAALASAAIPDLSPTGVVGSPDDPRDFSAAVVFDREGSRWRVRSPLHEEAAMRLETELQVLSGFTAGIRAALPFRVPSVAGAVRIGGMRTFVYHDTPGRELEVEELTALGGKTTDDIGRVIAAVHALPAAVVENADLPVYTADEFRQRRLNELDQAATTGRIPTVLLRRWENALEEMELWNFTPVVAHGDLHEDNLLVDQARLVTVTGWTDLHIGDPAEDFAWLASCGDQDFADAVVEAYWRHRAGGRVLDEHLLRRAVLAAEFALAQWLVRGISSGDDDMAAEAEAMLRELQADVEAHGGQEISATPTGPHAVPPLAAPAAAPLSSAAADEPLPERIDPDAGTPQAADGDRYGHDDRSGTAGRDADADREDDDYDALIFDGDPAPDRTDVPLDADDGDVDLDADRDGTPEGKSAGTGQDGLAADGHDDADEVATGAAEDTPQDGAATVLDLDEVRQLDIHRTERSPY
jgi:macrolide phosphotransferase